MTQAQRQVLAFTHPVYTPHPRRPWALRDRAGNLYRVDSSWRRKRPKRFGSREAAVSFRDRKVSQGSAPAWAALILALVLALLAAAQPVFASQTIPAEQWRHWGIKAGASMATYAALSEVGVDPDASAVIATLAPTVVGKLAYAPKGIGGQPDSERWPSVGFVLRDVAGEVCVQGAPILLRAVFRDQDNRIARALWSATVYGVALFACAAQLEVR